MTVRPATRADLSHLARIEGAADRLYVDLFGATDWEPPTDGRWRARQPGFLLVDDASLADDPGMGGHPVVGFAHVLEISGQAHLEQLAVEPSAQRQGRGSALVRAAQAEAARRGFRELTLRTYADVPWNAPFYARLGFVERASRTPLERRLEEVERRMGLECHGRRILMVTSVTPQAVTAE